MVGTTFGSESNATEPWDIATDPLVKLDAVAHRYVEIARSPLHEIMYDLTRDLTAIKFYNKGIEESIKFETGESAIFTIYKLIDILITKYGVDINDLSQSFTTPLDNILSMSSFSENQSKNKLVEFMRKRGAKNSYRPLADDSFASILYELRKDEENATKIILIDLSFFEINDPRVINTPEDKAAICDLAKEYNVGRIHFFSDRAIDIPVELRHFTKLKHLHFLGRSKLSQDSLKIISEITSLEELDLAKCNLTQLPVQFAQLTNLKYLDLSDNEFSQSALKVVSSITSLEELDLDRNRLTEVPDELSQLKNLKRLYLSRNAPWGSPACSNKIWTPPVWLTKLKKLKHLDLVAWDFYVQMALSENAIIKELEDRGVNVKR